MCVPISQLRRCAAEWGVPPRRGIGPGDVVAYCVEAEATIAAIRDWGCQVIAGNCEEQPALAIAGVVSRQPLSAIVWQRLVTNSGAIESRPAMGRGCTACRRHLDSLWAG
jgi:hypothetical protein